MQNKSTANPEILKAAHPINESKADAIDAFFSYYGSREEYEKCLDMMFLSSMNDPDVQADDKWYILIIELKKLLKAIEPSN